MDAGFCKQVRDDSMANQLTAATAYVPPSKRYQTAYLASLNAPSNANMPTPTQCDQWREIANRRSSMTASARQRSRTAVGIAAIDKLVHSTSSAMLPLLAICVNTKKKLWTTAPATNIVASNTNTTRHLHPRTSQIANEMLRTASKTAKIEPLQRISQIAHCDEPPDIP